MEKEYNKLRSRLKDLSKVAVAFSGGVDSSFLLKVSVDVLGTDKVIALTARSPLTFDEELQRAKDIAEEIGVEHMILDMPDLIDETIRDNPKDRCYHCKNKIFTSFFNLLESEFDGKSILIEGTNLDDVGSYRPGRKAIEELGVRSPLLESGLTKEMIRSLSRKLGLPTWDHPSQSCLATRIPYGVKLREEELSKVEKGEAYLKKLGFQDCRLRIHDNVARIELPKSDQGRLMSNSSKVIQRLKSLGFTYVTLDMEGLRSGSMDV